MIKKYHTFVVVSNSFYVRKEQATQKAKNQIKSGKFGSKLVLYAICTILQIFLINNNIFECLPTKSKKYPTLVYIRTAHICIETSQVLSVLITTQLCKYTTKNTLKYEYSLKTAFFRT